MYFHMLVTWTTWSARSRWGSWKSSNICSQSITRLIIWHWTRSRCYCWHLYSLDFLPSVVVGLTCDHANSEVVSSSALGVPGRALDTVGGAWLEVIKGHHGVTGVHLVAWAGALPDDAERVEDGVLHRGPGHEDGVVGRGGGVQLGRRHHFRQAQARRW